PFLPGRSGFKDVTAFYPSVGTTCALRRSSLRTPLQLHVESYDASVPLQVSPCVGHPAFSAETRSSVLQVFRSSLFPRNEGLPEELDREGEMHHLPIFWSSVSAIFRWRPQGGQRDENSTSLGLKPYTLCIDHSVD